MSSKQIRAIVVEDEQPSAENLMAIISRHLPQVTVLQWASNETAALQAVEEHKPDLVFLDIELGKSTAFDFLRRIDAIKFKIIFTTAYEDYAIQAIKFSAVDYLLKPIDIEELKSAVKKVVVNDKNFENVQNLLKSFQQNKLSKLPIPTREGYLMLPIEDIIYVKSDGSYSRVFVSDGEMIHVSKNLKSFEDALAEHNFVRIHRSYLVNVDRIERYVRGEGGYVVMDNNQTLEVSKRKKDSLVTLLKR